MDEERKMLGMKYWIAKMYLTLDILTRSGVYLVYNLMISLKWRFTAIRRVIIHLRIKSLDDRQIHCFVFMLRKFWRWFRNCRVWIFFGTGRVWLFFRTWVFIGFVGKVVLWWRFSIWVWVFLTKFCVVVIFSRWRVGFFVWGRSFMLHVCFWLGRGCFWL